MAANDFVQVQPDGLKQRLRTPSQMRDLLSINNVDNTADANKPVSTPQGTYIRGRDPVINLLDYVSNPAATDWAPYLNAAIAALNVAGGCLLLPAGDIPVDTGLDDIVDVHARILGQGKDITRILYHDASADLFRFIHTSAGWNWGVSHLTLIADGIECTEAAIRVVLPAAYTEQTFGGNVFEVGIKGTTWATDQFLFGILAANSLYMRVQNYSFIGKQLTDDACGVFITGDGSKDIVLDSCNQTYGFTLMKGDSGGHLIEGVSLIDCTVVATAWLMHIEDADNGPDFKVLGAHAQTFAGVVYLENASQLFVSDSTFYKRDPIMGEPASVAWQCFDLNNVPIWHIHDNFAYCVDPTDSVDDVFVDADGSDYGHAHDNELNAFDVCFNMHGTSDARIEDNTYTNVTGAFAINITETSTVRNNTNGSAEATNAFIDGDATPSVGNTYPTTFRTANTGPTTITNFDDGFNGQEFVLVINDVYTTIAHNANVILDGGKAWAPTIGTVLSFRRDGATWRETSGVRSSGTYTPTLTNGANVDATTAYPAVFSRVGNVVTVSGQLDIDTTAAGFAVTTVELSLPFASAFAAATDASGLVFCQSAFEGGTVFSYAPNDTAVITFSSQFTVNRPFTYQFQYIIL